MNRRRFIERSAALSAALPLVSHPSLLSTAARKRNIKLGFDNFSIRALGWKAPALLNYGHSLQVDTVLFSDLHVYEDHSPSYLQDIKKRGDDFGIEIQAGTGSICPTSTTYDDTFGAAEEHLSLAIRIASNVGSSVVRCFLGRAEDRATEGGLEARIADTIAVLKAVRNQALDAGIKIAVENHAGDMQGWQVAALIEEAGPEFVGATLDSGNATWTLEDPIANLKALGPYAVSTGIRDSMVWHTEEGARVQWMAMGEGLTDWHRYMDLYEELCPDTPVQLEIISGFSRPFGVKDDAFWEHYTDIRAREYHGWMDLAGRGYAVPSFSPPEENRQQANEAYQKAELERSIRYCKDVLGLGLK